MNPKKFVHNTKYSVQPLPVTPFIKKNHCSSAFFILKMTPSILEHRSCMLALETVKTNKKSINYIQTFYKMHIINWCY